MNIEFFQANLHNPVTMIPAIYAEWKSCYEYKAFKEYYPKLHGVNDRTIRQDKIVMVPNPYGLLDAKGNPLMEPKTVKANRIALPIQRLLVSRGKAFVTGGKVTLVANPEDDEVDTYKKVLKVWKDNKMRFKNGEIVQGIYAQTEAAEIWYIKQNSKGEKELKSSIYLPADGYDLIPVYDNVKDLIAFGLGYTTKRDKVTIQHMDIYTPDRLIMHEKQDAQQWRVAKVVNLFFKKIPVIYYGVAESLWEIVQPIIERLEYLVSNFGETNDYNGSPILFAKGKILGMSSKGETGKIIEAEGDADLKYISWDHAPESIKLEFEMLKEFIFSGCQIPNISFEELKLLGDISGVAYDRIMIDAHLKAKDMHEGVYGLGVQRRLNFLISAICNIYPKYEKGIDLDIEPEFGIFRIEDEADRIDNAMKANGGKPILDWEASVTNGGLSRDPEKTYKLLQKQQKNEQKATAAAKKVTVTA